MVFQLIATASLPTILLVSCIPWSDSFVLPFLRTKSSTHLPGELFDYEYIPPDSDSTPDFETDLSSSYPPGTPAGLRGEAIRSALRSGCCLGWKLNNQGVVQIKGPGTLDFLNGKVTQSIGSSGFHESCLLTSKGRIIDRIGVAVVNSDEAYLITSPGHSSGQLFELLNKYVFPLDKVTLTNLGDSSDMFSLASIRYSDLQTTFSSFVAPRLHLDNSVLPASRQCLLLALPQADDAGSILIIPSSGLHPCAGPGYTFVFLNTDVCDGLWKYLTSEDCPQGPVAAGELEYETLRIESGQPGFGTEMNTEEAKVSPIDLHLTATHVDTDKGCYLGQEGVASILKNPRGPPRALYHVIFDDETNFYDHQSRGEFVVNNSETRVENLTRIPRQGDKLFVLGSNEQISVGTITSIAEPSSNGEDLTIGMALVRRADSIRRQMTNAGIDLPSRQLGGNGEVLPPPLDSLDGIEVIVGGTFTVGRLQMLPGRAKKRLFVNDVPDFVYDLPGDDEVDDGVSVSYGNDEIDLTAIEEQLAKAQLEAQEAEAESRRKAEKMEMLRKRAEEAMARRKQKKSHDGRQ